MVTVSLVALSVPSVSKSDGVDGGTRCASQAREGIAYLWTTVLGHPGRPLAPVLGVRPQNVYRAAAHGQAAATAWDRLLTTC